MPIVAVLLVLLAGSTAAAQPASSTAAIEPGRTPGPSDSVEAEPATDATEVGLAQRVADLMDEVVRSRANSLLAQAGQATGFAIRSATASELERLVGAAERLPAGPARFERLAPVLGDPGLFRWNGTHAYQAAEYGMAQSLLAMGASGAAGRQAERLVARGSRHPYFQPALDLLIQVATSRGDEDAIGHLEAALPASDQVAARGHLQFLRGRMAYRAGDWAGATRAFSELAPGHAWYLGARHLMALAAVQQGELARARALSCQTADHDPGAPSVLGAVHPSGELDQARLAAGRLAHELGQFESAFVQYGAVPADSDLVAEAMFEGAQAMYEAERFDVGLDLLSELEAHAPEAPVADEALILRGHLQLGACDFEAARVDFETYGERYGDLPGDLALAQGAPTRIRALRLGLLGLDDPSQRAPDDARLLALLRADQGVSELGDALRRLRLAATELAGTATVLATLARSLGAPPEAAATDPDRERPRLFGDPAGPGGAPEMRARRRLWARARAALPALIVAERAHVASLEARRGELLALVLAALDGAVRDQLRTLSRRLVRGRRQARLGVIDALLLDKERVEGELEALAEGRALPPPPAAPAPPRLMGSREAYWPRDGEHWEDEAW